MGRAPRPASKKLADAAKLAVEDRIRGGKPPRFVPYRAFNRAAVARKNAFRGPKRGSGP